MLTDSNQKGAAALQGLQKYSYLKQITAGSLTGDDRIGADNKTHTCTNKGCHDLSTCITTNGSSRAICPTCIRSLPMRMRSARTLSVASEDPHCNRASSQGSPSYLCELISEAAWTGRVQQSPLFPQSGKLERELIICPMALLWRGSALNHGSR